MLTVRPGDARHKTRNRKRLFDIPLVSFGEVLVGLTFWSCPGHRGLVTDPSLRLDQEGLIDLHRFLAERFDEDELMTLCFYLNVDYEALAARGKSGKARELIKHMQRRGRLPNLVQRIRDVRPDISWRN
jgi:hypothetical protein